MQGVTTVITNNDGGGPIDIGNSSTAWTKSGIGTNAAIYVGQGSVRGRCVGMSDTATDAGAARLDARDSSRARWTRARSACRRDSTTRRAATRRPKK